MAGEGEIVTTALVHGGSVRHAYQCLSYELTVGRSTVFPGLSKALSLETALLRRKVLLWQSTMMWVTHGH